MPSTDVNAVRKTGVYPGWFVVLAAFFGVMVSFGSLLVFTFGIFLKPLSAEFGWSRESVSAAFGIAAMTVAVCSPILGRLLDHYPPHRIILPCMIVFGLTLGSLAFLTPSLLHLYGTFVLLGIVGNGTTQMGYSRAVSSWFSDKRGTALALVMAGVGCGAVIFPYVSQRIIDSLGWRSAYLVLGCCVLLFGVPLTALFVRERTIHADDHDSMSVGFTTREGLTSAAFWILVCNLFLGSIAVNGAVTHLSPLLTDRRVGLEQAALAVSVLGAASFCGRLITGHLLDRFFGPRVSFCLLLGVAAGIQLLSVVQTGMQGLVAAALIGFGLGGEADVTPYLLTRYFGLRSFSTLYGFTWTAYAIAGGVGPMLMGKAFDATGSYGPLLSLLAVTTVVAAVLLLFLPRYPVALETDRARFTEATV